jgi:hypothetical protein
MRALTAVTKLKPLSYRDIVLLSLVAVGLILRAAQYASGRSLWLDEAMLSLNIVQRSFTGLLQPLDYNQGAPIGFLLIEKIFVAVLGGKDFVLRLFPFISGCAALILLHAVARRHMAWPGAVVAVGLFATDANLIYYTSEVKQYATDAAIAIFLFWLVANHIEKPNPNRRDFLLIGLVSAVSLFFSHPALFVTASVMAVLILRALIEKDRESLIDALIAAGIWLISFGALYFVSLRGLSANAYLLDYWAEGFLPLDGTNVFAWFVNLSGEMLPAALFGVQAVSLILFLIGTIGLWKRKWEWGALITFAFSAALIASAVQRYPFQGRMILFLVPLMIVAMGAGAGWIASIFQSNTMKSYASILLIALILFAPFEQSAANALAPKMREHIRPLMQYLQENHKPGDQIYVYYGAAPAFAFYATDYGFSASDYVWGGEHPDQPDLYLPELDALRGGKRVWVVFAHVFETGDFNEKDFILGYLDQIGEKKREFKAPGTSTAVFLYDLSKSP